MKLSEVFEQLSYGELSNLSIGGAQAGVIDESNYPQLISHINLGLLALYKRFPLKENKLTVKLQAGKITYSLNSEYAVNNRRSRQATRHLIDTVDAPFEDDIFKVERVYTDLGYEMSLNDSLDEYSLATPSATLLQVPWDVAAQLQEIPDELKTENLTVHYRAMHPVIPKTLGGGAPRFDLELPFSHLEPLLLFVASRVNNPIGLGNEFNAGNTYAAKYEKSCQALEVANLRVDQGSQSRRLVSNGWV